jgi:hypothetical protein
MANKRNQNTNTSRPKYTKEVINNLKPDEIQIFPDNNYHIGFLKVDKLQNLLKDNEFTPKQKLIFLREITTSQIKKLSNDDLQDVLQLTPLGIQRFTQKQIQALNQSQIEYILNNDKSQAAKQYLIDNLTSEQKQGIQQQLTPAVVPPVAPKALQTTQKQPEVPQVAPKKINDSEVEQVVQSPSSARLSMTYMPVIISTIAFVLYQCISYNNPDITR